MILPAESAALMAMFLRYVKSIFVSFGIVVTVFSSLSKFEIVRLDGLKIRFFRWYFEKKHSKNQDLYFRLWFCHFHKLLELSSI